MEVELWVDKHKPQTLKEVVGNRTAVGKVLQFLLIWQKGRPEKRGLVLVGDSGIGKTLVTYLAAKQLGYDVVESNASDTRTQDAIKLIEVSMFSRSVISGTPKVVVFLDEVDGIQGNADKGGMAELCESIPHSRNPVILTANDISHPKFKSLLNHVYVVEFEPLIAEEMVPFLLHICKSEGIDIEIDILYEMVELSHGDMRLAINNLQAYVQGGKVFYIKARSEGSLEKLLLKECDEVPDVDRWYAIQWLNENLPRCITDKGKLLQALDLLVLADSVSQSYFKHLIHYIVQLCDKKPDYFRFPENLAMKSANKVRREVENDFAKQLSTFIHDAPKNIVCNTLPYLRTFSKDYVDTILHAVGVEEYTHDKIQQYWSGD